MFFLSISYSRGVFIIHWFIANLRVGKLIYMLWFFYICLQCMGVINLGGEVGCMISEGPWVFVGIPNIVKVRWEANSRAFCLLYGTMLLFLFSFVF